MCQTLVVILVVGATGNVGGAAVKELARSGHKVRALSRDPSRLPGADDLVEPVRGDMEQPDTIAAAMNGVESVLLCAGGRDLPAVEAEAMRLAEAASVRHLVLLSSLGVELKAGSGPMHEPSETNLRASSLAWTILRPISFMTNALRWRDSIRATGTFEEPTGQGRQAMIDPADIGAVAAMALTTPGHEGKTYELTGPEALTSAQYAEVLTAALGRPVRHIDVPLEEFRAGFARAGMPAFVIDPIVNYFALIRAGKLDMVTPDVEAVLGRPARPFVAWAQENVTAFA